MYKALAGAVISLLLIFVTCALIITQFDDQEDSSKSGLPEVRPLTPDERCEKCQFVLKTVYGHFSAKVASRRKLAHQLKHECNRDYQYRRRCILFTRMNTEIIFQEMKSPIFKPLQPCTVLKECKPLQSPIVEPTTNATAAPAT